MAAAVARRVEQTFALCKRWSTEKGIRTDALGNISTSLIKNSYSMSSPLSSALTQSRGLGHLTVNSSELHRVHLFAHDTHNGRPAGLRATDDGAVTNANPV